VKIPEGLTPLTLRDLYLRQLKTETEIASLFGTYQVHIGRIRVAWGIPVLGRTGRMTVSLPSVLSPYQEQVLIGSLLGDGTMSGPGPHSARFSEGHSLAQAEYTAWKAGVLQPFTSGTYDTVKKDPVTGREFHGFSLITHACTQLRFYYDLFYPLPNRKRIFPEDLHQRMTPLILAVWYMDDGSRSVRGEPSISFGLDDLSRERVFQALRLLGLDPKSYGEKGDQKICFPKQSYAFRSLVEPYLYPIPCMRYKIPQESGRQAGDRNARRFPSEKARILYEEGDTKDHIAKIFGVGISTVSRRLKAVGTRIRKSGPRTRVFQ
jgi:hypothetical protein